MQLPRKTKKFYRAVFLFRCKCFIDERLYRKKKTLTDIVVRTRKGDKRVTEIRIVVVDLPVVEM